MTMVVRVLTDNQYYVPDENIPDIEQLDDQLNQAMDEGDDQKFRRALDALVALVRQGNVVPDEVIIPSQIIIPAPDMSLAEAHQRLQTMEARTPSQSGQEPQNS